MLRAWQRSIKYQFYSLWIDLTRDRLEPTIYLTRGVHANHYVADAVPKIQWKKQHTYHIENKNVIILGVRYLENHKS